METQTVKVKREISRAGWYTKYHNGNEDEILSFVAKNQDDNFFKVMQMIRKKQRSNGFQCCEPKEEESNFKNVFYVRYNLWGQPMKGKFLFFDFEAETVTTEEGKTYKIVVDYEYTYRIQKTQIKAIDGIKGFYSHIVESMHVHSAFNNLTYRAIEKL